MERLKSACVCLHHYDDGDFCSIVRWDMAAPFQSPAPRDKLGNRHLAWLIYSLLQLSLAHEVQKNTHKTQTLSWIICGGLNLLIKCVCRPPSFLVRVWLSEWAWSCVCERHSFTHSQVDLVSSATRMGEDLRGKPPPPRQIWRHLVPTASSLTWSPHTPNQTASAGS